MPFSDLVFEHRMYLALAPVVAFAVLGGYSLGNGLLQRLPVIVHPQLQGRRIALALITVIVVSLGFATARRNVDYKSGLTMWSDVVRKRPDNARAHNNLGEILAERNDLENARAQFYEAVRLDPIYFDAQFNLGNSLALDGNLNEAKSHMIQALLINPERPNAHFALGAILARQCEWEGAANEFRIVVSSKPDYAEAHQRLGLALEKEGRIAEAKMQYDVVLRLRPDWPGLRDHVTGLQ
jgi:Flp pilus assembly protein TadD